MRYLSLELGEQQIRVNTISAGPIKTLSAMAVGGIDDQGGAQFVPAIRVVGPVQAVPLGGVRVEGELAPIVDHQGDGTGAGGEGRADGAGFHARAKGRGTRVLVLARTARRALIDRTSRNF